MTDRRTTSKSPAVAYAAAILRFLAESERPLGLAAVARAVSVSPSSCLNILRTLVAENLVAFDDGEKTYTLGSDLVSLARRALDPGNAFGLARPALRRLAREQNVTAALWRESEGERITLLGFETSGRDMHLHMATGQRLPLLSGAVGRSIAAASIGLRPRLEALFGRVRWEDAPSYAEYAAEVAVAEARGWSIDAGRFRRGVTTIASPVGVAAGAERAGLVVSGSMLGVHHDPKELDAIGAEVLATAQRLAQLQGA